MLKTLLKRLAFFVAPKWAATLSERWWLTKQARMLKEKCSGGMSLEEMIGEMLTNPVFTLGQKKTEFLALLRLLAEQPPHYLCEIGARKGGSLFMFCQVASP